MSNLQETGHVFPIQPISKSELAIQQRCSVGTIRNRFKELGIDTGYKKLLTIFQLKVYYETYGFPGVMANIE